MDSVTDSAICLTCGTQFPPSSEKPELCPICEDDRQYIGHSGQQWSTLEELRASHTNVVTEIASGLTSLRSDPQIAIGQQTHIVRTDAGNVLWECISLVDDIAVREIERQGGVQAIGISHPHFYSSMIEWSRALGDVPIYLHEDNRPWVMRPDPMVHFWSGDSFEMAPGATIVRTGGHFPGSSVLHWAAGAGGKGAMLTGDTINVVADRRWVSFMYSYPNQIPLGVAAIEGIVAAVEPYEFDMIYGSWPGSVVATDAKNAVRRSAERYIAHITS